MIYFIETFNKIKPIEISNFYNTLKSNYDIISKNSVTADEILNSMKFLAKYEYDFSKGKTSLIEFYELILGKEEAITFLKELQDKNMDIKTFNEFIDEQENSQLTTNDVDNLLDTFEFFKKLVENKNIISDIALIENFKKSCEKEKNIMIKMKEYLKCYGELIELNKILVKNPEATAKKVEKILNSSEVEFYKNADEAKQIFIRGARRAKGTTQEMGMTESFFANPFGPVQREAQTRVIIDKMFDQLFKTGVPVGNLHTRLAVSGMEHEGPQLAAKKLFELLEK
jgi:hypothetical protein